jgi:predicted acetyltransferase
VSVEFRLLTADDDLEPDLDLARRAFGPFGEAERERRLASARASVVSGRYLGAFDGSRQVGSARYFDMRQWWHGRSLPMAGVAGVKVAPEERGRGVGRGLMTELLAQIAERGYPLSALYPATTGLYRSVGWELAGGQYQVEVPARSLRSLQPPDRQALPDGPGVRAGAGDGSGAASGAASRAAPVIRRGGPADAARMITLIGELHARGRDCGPVTFDTESFAHSLDDEDIYCYLAADGLLAYQWNRSDEEVLVYGLQAGSAATTRMLWAIVASHGTIARSVRAIAAPADPVSWLVREPDVRLARREMWMLRLVDAPAAIAGRGFPDGTELAVPLALHDGERPSNSGQWLLQVSGGKGELSRSSLPASAAPPLRLGSRGLAALYAGTPLATLRGAGLAADGDLAADAAVDEAFTGTAFMYDYF